MPGELISGFVIPGRWPRSLYVKARDRQSYEFALASAAVALDLQDGVVRDARVALGGVATMPWRAREAEAVLKGERFDDALAQRAGEAAFASAEARQHNSFKIALGKAWSRARCSGPRQWRFDHVHCRTRTESQHGATRSAL